MTDKYLTDYLSGIAMDAKYYGMGKSWKVEIPGKGHGDSLSDHDRKYHHGEAPKGSCKFREELKKKDDVDDLSSGGSDKRRSAKGKVIIPVSELGDLFKSGSPDELVSSWKDTGHGDLALETLKDKTPSAYRFAKLVKSGDIPEDTARKILSKLAKKGAGMGLSGKGSAPASLDTDLSSLSSAIASMGDTVDVTPSKMVDYWMESDVAEEDARSGYATGAPAPALADMIAEVRSGRMSREDAESELSRAGIGDRSDSPVDESKTSDKVNGLSRLVRRAARTVNRHIDRGDFKPNPHKLAKLDEAEKGLRDVIDSGDTSAADRAYAAGLLHAIRDIRKTVDNGAKDRVGWVSKAGYDPSDTARRSRRSGVEGEKPVGAESHSPSDAESAAHEYLEEVEKTVPSSSTKKDVGESGKRVSDETVEKALAKIKKTSGRTFGEPIELDSDTTGRWFILGSREGKGSDTVGEGGGNLEVRIGHDGSTVFGIQDENDFHFESTSLEETMRMAAESNSDWENAWREGDESKHDDVPGGVEIEKSTRAWETVRGSDIKDILAKKYDFMKEADEIEKKAKEAASPEEANELMDESIFKKNIGYSLSHFCAKDGGLSEKDAGGAYKSNMARAVANMRRYLHDKYAAAVDRHGSEDNAEQSRSIRGIREAIKVAGGILGFTPYAFEKDGFKVKWVS